jgi:hypothetical protein
MIYAVVIVTIKVAEKWWFQPPKVMQQRIEPVTFHINTWFVWINTSINAYYISACIKFISITKDKIKSYYFYISYEICL